MKYKNTIVTACDSLYHWGAFLLIASLKFHKVKTLIHILGYQLTEREIHLLSQFSNVKVIPSNNKMQRSICTLKPDSIFSTETEWVTWMDADCIVTNNIFANFKMQKNFIIRFREKAENREVYRNKYSKNDVIGSIPNIVLATWQKDVGERKTSNINTVCTTNCFMIHRSHFPFIEKWKSQMDKVIPDTMSSVYDKKSLAYFMTDESVLNSLFAFLNNSPTVSEYPFDKGVKPEVVHFGLRPKPWEAWTRRDLIYYDDIQRILDWCQKEGYEIPPLPKSFQKKYKFLFILFAYLRSIAKRIKSLLKFILRF